MTEGVVEAWRRFGPTCRSFFTIHGTGEDEAIALVRDGSAWQPYDLMDDAVQRRGGGCRGTRMS